MFFIHYNKCKIYKTVLSLNITFQIINIMRVYYILSNNKYFILKIQRKRKV